ncbi:MAG: hypothetical protein M1819_000381 [Sarea resinae]|nr:MAG: hypothetical protein M1819_000381 [Sarea resinae]
MNAVNLHPILPGAGRYDPNAGYALPKPYIPPSNLSSYGNRGAFGSTGYHQPYDNSSGRSNTPRNKSTQQGEHGQKKGDSDDSIMAHLQIPSAVNDSKGSLADFAAQITCLFWFESSSTLNRVEESSTTPVPITPLVPEAIPSLGFRKWVTTILSTTQVTQNVVLLALLFIYRLKKLNPTVKGKPGSEFRLLTVALMLGNKFLDDNTYTNKTWAEVSGISVQEIHIMEVEFLSNMKYSLYTSEAEWKEWHAKLGKFWGYFDKASKTPMEVSPKALGPPTPTRKIPPSLPSPPASTHASPPFALNYSPNGSMYPNPLPPPTQMAPSLPPYLGPMVELDPRQSSRKRSYDDHSQEPPTKRVTRSAAPPVAISTTMAPSTLPGISSHMPRLPVPNLSISTSQPLGGYNGLSAHLPPPTAGRPMSTAFPGQMHWSQPGLVSSSTVSAPSNMQSGVFSPFGDQSRRQSPYSMPSAGSSPTSAIFPAHSQQQDHLSPTFYLNQRSSPYRPVRTVNTLLVPPPSASMQIPQHLGLDQMHYQPLGKSLSECKTGIVPYMHSEPWPQMHQLPQWMVQPQPSLN